MAWLLSQLKATDVDFGNFGKKKSQSWKEKPFLTSRPSKHKVGGSQTSHRPRLLVHWTQLRGGHACLVSFASCTGAWIRYC